MNRQIVITDSNLGDGTIERGVLEPDFEVRLHQVLSEEEVTQVAAGAAGLLVQWAPITDAVLGALPDLEVVVRYGIGLDNIDLEAAARHGVAVHNVDDYCLAEVADHAVAAIYAHHRRLTVASRVVAEDGWTTSGFAPPRRPAADPVGIAGFGRIGREVGRRAAALGFAVHAWDPFIDHWPDGIEVHGTLVELAGAVNHLTVHVPTTAETRGIVDAAVLAALGPDGHLVNTARGALVDEPALLAALDAGTVGFASLDVLGSEPPTGTASDLARHRRVLVTPHIAYLSTESLPMLQRRAAEILRDSLAGTEG